MKQVRYNYASNVLRLEYPPEWEAESITGVTITIKDDNGSTILTATAATVLASVALDGSTAISSGDNTVTLSADTNTYVAGDIIRIHGDGPKEDREVTHYDSNNVIVTVAEVFDYDHAVTSKAYGMFATYTLDTTTTSDYTSGRQLVVYWQPDIDVAPLSQLYEVAKANEFSASDFEQMFSALYPDEYEVVRDRLLKTKEIAETQLSYRLKSRGMLMERVKDQEVLAMSLLTLTRYLLIRGFGEAYQYETAQALSAYNMEFDLLCSLPIWSDDNQDDVKDDEEVNTHDPWLLDRGM